MILGNQRENYRAVFFNAYKKYQKKLPLEPLEKQLLQIILDHPHYHFIFENEQNQKNDAWDKQLKENPFLHMSLHISIRDQLAMDQPKGILAIYHDLVLKVGDTHEAEHLMMQILVNTLREMMEKNMSDFDEELYLNAIRQKLI